MHAGEGGRGGVGAVGCRGRGRVVWGGRAGETFCGAGYAVRAACDGAAERQLEFQAVQKVSPARSLQTSGSIRR